MHFTKKKYVHGKRRSLGEKLSDGITKYAGSWSFIIIFLLIVLAWMMINNYLKDGSFDPFPYILLNLALSLLAAIQAPVILMSQNREEQRDRVRAELDYAINKKAEREVQDMQKDLEEIKKLIRKIK
ncbi:DUF1003 domain-containing protein [Candidatus Woesearchaeota archaeon]|nr:DUF1003 domain-containing protein [Candidatus Woesearchaeota archaeon]